MLPRFTFTGRARPFLEIGIGDTRTETQTARWDSARWDAAAARWSGIEPSWVDVSCNVFAAEWTYGRRRALDRFAVGEALIAVDNESGWADPYAVTTSADLPMRPGRAIRIGVDHVTLGRLVQWRGFIDEVIPIYEAGQPLTATLRCIDALGEVNRAKIAGNAMGGAGDSAAERITWLLDNAVWPSAKRDVASSSTTLVAAELNGQIADLLGQAAESAGGVIFGDRSGDVVFRNRDWQTFPPDTPVAATIGNEPGDVCPSAWVRPFARRDIATLAIVGRDRETAAVRVDEQGRSLYGVEPYERVDLWTESDAELAGLAQRALRVRSHATAPVVRGVVLNADSADDALDLIATADPYAPTHYRCRLSLDGRDIFDADHIVTGAVHELTADTWTATLNLDLAAPWIAAGGRWDSGRWDHATWAAAV